ncbi:MAG: DUF3631 domain-containing protein [Candidatus Binatia bacterium]
MMSANSYDTDAYDIDVLSYLEELSDTLTFSECLEHYHVLKVALLRLQSEDAAAFELALKQVAKKLKIKTKTVREEIDALREPAAAKDARELLDKMTATRVLRLAQDYVDEKLWFGVVAGEEKLLVNSDRELLTIDKLSDEFTIRDNGFDMSRFSKDAIVRFITGANETGSELLTDLQTFFTRFAVFRDKRIALLLATWTLATYCYRVFRVFAYLALRSPDKRCGKSRVLDLLSLIAFNASSRVVHPTEAQIFRAPSRNGGTLLLDEVESLAKANKDNYAALLSVLNSGFERGGTVSRLEKNSSGNFHEVSFDTYCPRALAGINKTAETLEDRSIIIVMQRKLAREKTERFSPSRIENEAQVLRDRCYIYALTHAADLAAVYDEADKFSALDALDDRARDLWEPLVSIVALADVERNDEQQTLTAELTALARDLSEVRDGAAEDSTAVQVVKALQAIVTQKRQDVLFQNAEAVTLTPTDLSSLLKEKLNWEKLSTRTLASLLNPLGFYSKNTRIKDKVTLAYHLSEETLTELSERYSSSSTENEEKK